MRSNSGSGKSNNNLRDPTMKEHEEARHKSGEAHHGIWSRQKVTRLANPGNPPQDPSRSTDHRMR